MEEKDILVSTIQAQNAMNASLSKTIDSQSKTIESLELRIKELSAQVAYLNRQLFGRKSAENVNTFFIKIFTNFDFPTQYFGVVERFLCKVYIRRCF